MRGPYERLKYDLRRLWECPVCKHTNTTEFEPPEPPDDYVAPWNWGY